MKANIIFALVLTLSFASCKTEDKKAAEAKSDVVTITVNAIVKQDDDFQIFFKEDNSVETPFDELQSVWHGVKGVETSQDIVFSLPENTAPTALRFDLGINKRQPAITVNTIKISKGNKVINISGQNLLKYFRPDEKFIKIDSTSGQVTPLLVGDYYDPMIFSTDVLNAELVKLSE